MILSTTFKWASLFALSCALMGCASSTNHQARTPGSTFSECDQCPNMVFVPAGSYVMGSTSTDPGHVDDESPQVEIEITAFAVSKHEVTVGEFKAFVKATGYEDESICLSMQENGTWNYNGTDSWRNPGFEQSDDHPVVCLSWNAVNEYVAWLNEKTQSADYRLLTESEWEYTARAGTTSTYWWGEKEDDFCTITNGVDQSAKLVFPNWERSGGCDDGFVYTAPVGHYQKPNIFGVEDMVGNVWEWTFDCYADTYVDKPRNGSAQIDSICEKRVMRGGAWGDYGSFYLRSAYRGAWDPTQSFTNLGFRVAKTLRE